MRNVLRLAYFVWLSCGMIACAGQPSPTIDHSQLPIDNSPFPTPSPALLISPSLPLPNTPTPLPPTDTPTPEPSPTPAPQLIQLTSNGCCVQPFFSPDSTHLRFLDKPAPDAPTGIYQIPLTGGEPELFTTKLGLYSPDMQLVAYPEGGQTYLERLADAERWTIPNGGRSISFSPSGAQVAWVLGQPGPPFDSALREIRVGTVDGSEARQVITLIGGGFAGWVSETQILVTGQPSDGDESALWVLSLEEDGQRELARGGRIRSVSVAPGGAWVVYLVTFSTDPAQDGIWMQNIATGERFKLDLLGGYRWRDADHLLVIPLDPNAASGPVASHQLWEVDTMGVSRALTDPARLPFKVAEGDWTVSPDGQWVAFVSATDHNIWVIKIHP
ncbi:MAG: PD40 domain-containing protein [Anaerolineales bacterium]|nr:PD40 domain-containing protein [Anaerolineales bacterium]